jgi:glycerol-3-phosphate dehydrogenase (NAD(P)+)
MSRPASTAARPLRVAVLGDGAWGTAVALVLVGNGHRTTLWGPFPDYLGEIRKVRENVRFLPGVALSAGLELEPDMAVAVADAELLVLASPAQYLRGTLGALRPHHDPRRHRLVNLAKGIEVATRRRMSEVCREVLGSCRYAVLSGPSHAEEVARDKPTAVVVAAADPADADFAQGALMSESFRVYTSDDVTGAELGGSLKNVFAIAAGMVDGMGLGDNPKAALMTRGIAEMARLGGALGGRPETFSGLSGIGDLIVTCCSGHSRNRHVGEELGRGKALAEILAAMGMAVAEGVPTAEAAHALAMAAGVDAPIIREIHAVLHQGKPPRLALRDLMARPARPERDAPSATQKDSAR